VLLYRTVTADCYGKGGSKWPTLKAWSPARRARTLTLGTRLSVKLADIHYLSVKERDFVQRAALFDKAHADEKSFFEGRQVPLPPTALMDMLLEDGERPLADFLTYYWWNHYEERTLQLRGALSVGDAPEGLTYLDQHLAALGTAITVKEQRLILSRAIIQAEIDALGDIRKADNARYRALTDRLAAEPKAAVTRVLRPSPVSGCRRLGIGEVHIELGCEAESRL